MRQTYPIELCDAHGMSPCGSDGKGHYDRRLGLAKIANVARRMRERYAAHFPHMYASFTHFRLQSSPKVYPITRS